MSSIQNRKTVRSSKSTKWFSFKKNSGIKQYIYSRSWFQLIFNIFRTILNFFKRTIYETNFSILKNVFRPKEKNHLTWKLERSKHNRETQNFALYIKTDRKRGSVANGRVVNLLLLIFKIVFIGIFKNEGFIQTYF